MAREHDAEVVFGVVADASGAQEGLNEVEQAAESAAQKTASSAAKAADDVVSETETAAKKVSEKVKDTAGQSEKETTSAGEKIKKKSRETSDQVGTDAEKAGKKTQTSAQETKEKVLAQFQAGQVAIGNLISQCVTKVLDAGKTLIQTGVTYNEQLEKYQVGLTNMLGSAESANAALEAIKQDAARTPFDTASLVQANQLLIGAGENAEYSRKTILALGDAVSATGGGSAELERMVQNLQQIANVGKASSVDIKQFAMAGINIYQILADYTGKSVQDVQDMTISYDVLTKALQAAAEEGGRYYDSMNTQSQTLKGSIDTLKDNFTQLTGAMLEGMTDGLKDLTQQATGWVQELKEALENEGMEGMLACGAEIAGSLVQGFAEQVPNLVESASEGLTACLEYFTANMDAIVETGGEILGGIVTGFVDHMPEIVAAASNLVAALLGKIVENFSLFLTSGGDITENVAHGVESMIESAITAAGNVAASIKDALFSINWSEAGMEMLRGVVKGFNWQNVKAAFWDAAAAIALNDDDYQEYKKTGGMYGTSTYSGSGKNYQQGSTKDDNYWKNYGDRLAAQYGLTSNSNQDSDSGTDWESVISSLTGNNGGSSSKKKNTGTKKTVTERTDWSQQDGATTYSSNEYGTITKQTTELTEHILKSDGTAYTKFTKTMTESGKEMVNGVVKNYKQITTYVDKFDQNGKKIGKTVAQTQKVYSDAADSIAKTTTRVSQETIGGVTKTTQEVTEKMGDGNEHIKKTVTKTGERVEKGVRETYTIVETYLDGFLQDTKETCNEVETTITATQTRIDNALSGAKSQLGKGIFGIVQSAVGNLKNQNWSGLALNAVQLIFGEIDQPQREVLATWAEDSLKAINEAYASGGLRNGLQAISDLFLKGITPAINGSTTAAKSLASVLDGLSKSGGIGGLLGTSGQQLLSLLTTFGTGMGSAATGIGAALTSAASGLTGVLASVTTGLASAFTMVGGLISANPVLAAVLAIGLGIVGLGAAIWAIYGRKKKSSDEEETKPTSSTLEFTRNQNDVKRPTPGTSGTYTPSETITAAELVRRTQAASAVNQRSFTHTQNGTSTTADQQLSATMHGSLTATFNVDGHELARVTAPYYDEELAFLQ